MLNKKEISSRELIESVLEWIYVSDVYIHSFISIDEKRALKQADNIDKLRINNSEKLPELTGIPYGLKDNICTKDFLTTCGSKIIKNFKPSFDGTVVKKLNKAHAVLIGKLNMDEFAIGSTGETSVFQHTRNPWAEDRVPGGSSGASAASVASDQVFFSLGSDTGGSIRQPASFCGVVGLKPTIGCISGYGLIPFATSLDQLGPLCKDVTDCAIVMNAIAGYDPKDRMSAKINHPNYSSFLKDNISGMRIGLPLKWMEGKLEDDVKNAINNAVEIFRKLGASLEEIHLPHAEYFIPTYFLISSAEASYNLTDTKKVYMGYKKGEIPELEDLNTNIRLSGLGSEAKKRILLGNIGLSVENYEKYYMKALKVRTLIIKDFEEIFKNFDLILSPTNPRTAFQSGQSHEKIIEMIENDVFTVPVNLAGLPAISIPCGFDSKGLPIGMQLIGKPFQEGDILRAAYTYEQNMDHHLKSPLLSIS